MMNKLPRIASTLAALAALTAVAAPAAAAAEETTAAAAEAPRQGLRKGAAPFPQDAARFSKGVDEKIAKQRAKVEAKMQKGGVPDARRAEVRKALDEVQAKVRAAVDAAARDGVITQEEAKRVRKVAREARKAIGKQLGLEQKPAKKQKRGKGTKRILVPETV
ncbi:hypothetical protein [Sorangium sp. So ce385]|uniref:hypothetical protein n=1 Tax=Sorangium sp. So ce385 TaxID=3133308 RepID=UPI003F5CA1F7